mgnify:CR=1 FL=1
MVLKMIPNDIKNVGIIKDTNVGIIKDTQY